MKQYLSMILEIFWPYIASVVSLFTPVSKEDRVLIEKLRSAVSKKNINDSDSNEEWQDNINTIKYLIQNNDPRFFLSWPVIQKTMFANSYLAIEKESQNLLKFNYLHRIKESKFGFPLPFISHLSLSGNILHLAHHLLAYEKTTNKKIKNMDLIFEFGGGYGSMSRLVYEFGFKGKYVIFDFPIFSALQAFYLRKMGYSVSMTSKNEASIYCLSSLEEIEKVLVSNNMKNSMFIATWSLSESPMSVRKSISPLFKYFSSYLIAYQKSFGNVDNLKYFSNFDKYFNKSKKKYFKLLHLVNNYYLFGY